jgi:hypothetical protein
MIMHNKYTRKRQSLYKKQWVLRRRRKKEKWGFTIPHTAKILNDNWLKVIVNNEILVSEIVGTTITKEAKESNEKAFRNLLNDPSAFIFYGNPHTPRRSRGSV